MATNKNNSSNNKTTESDKRSKVKVQPGVKLKGAAKKPFFTVRMTHTEDTFKALAHMQYDLFCRRNYVARTIVSLGCIAAAVLNMESWWAYLLIVYGVFLATGKYNQSNHTAKKLANAIKAAHQDFPSSKFVFEDQQMRVYSISDHAELEPLEYTTVARLGRDRDYYYIFRNSSGGYMIPRDQLGENDQDFVDFIKSRTGKGFYTKHTPPIVKFYRQLKGRS